MSISKKLFAVFAMLGASLVMVGCSADGNPRFGGFEEDAQPGYEQLVEDQRYGGSEEPSQSEVDQAAEESYEQVREELGLDAWSCTISVTYNDDWHDDVLCRNGSAVDRPYLREWDSFVEEWEILESAAEYEAELNAR
ncbi:MULTISPECIES: hypothetical protein [Microbacterium]|uniref:hypothetical protein n=1 Tax=Microbacterium TaxID=33882 RepID=UPI0004933217|nr:MULTISPECIES: hypothetical protein [unclassified Microbacterium]